MTGIGKYFQERIPAYKIGIQYVMSKSIGHEGRLLFQTYNPFEDYGPVEELWNIVLEKSRHSYFTSWGWISTWIKSLPAESGVRLIVGFQNDSPILAFFTGHRKYTKYGFLPSRTISLNSTGDHNFDRLYIEYNSILSDEFAGSFVQELLDYLASLGWDEFILPGLSSEFVQNHALQEVASGRFHVLLDEVSNSYYVDLEKIRAAGMDYMKLLSANKRSQIRRSIKQYELEGKVEAEEARTPDEALAMFAELVVMHQQEWNRRGEPGVFAGRFMLQFHQELIRSRFDHGEIQLLRIRTPSTTLGYLYSFMYRGEVLFYQSGLKYAAGNVYRPGLVSHYFAILYNAGKGMLKYDFLAGESDYKRSLSTDSTSMYWMRWIKSQPRFLVERNILALKNRIKSMPELARRMKKARDFLRSIRA
jgi:hypothetical protein